MTEVYSWYEQIRCQNGLLGQLWLTSALEWTHAWLFCCCSLFKNRMMGYSHVTVSINTVAHWFQGRVNASIWHLQFIVFRLHVGFCTCIYKLINWLFWCDLNINHWLNHLRSCRRLKHSDNHGIARTLASSQTWRPFCLSNCFGTLFSSRTCRQKSI